MIHLGNYRHAKGCTTISDLSRTSFCYTINVSLQRSDSPIFFSIVDWKWCFYDAKMWNKCFNSKYKHDQEQKCKCRTFFGAKIKRIKELTEKSWTWCAKCCTPEQKNYIHGVLFLAHIKYLFVIARLIWQSLH